MGPRLIVGFEGAVTPAQVSLLPLLLGDAAPRFVVGPEMPTKYSTDPCLIPEPELNPLPSLSGTPHAWALDWGLDGVSLWHVAAFLPWKPTVALCKPSSFLLFAVGRAPNAEGFLFPPSAVGAQEYLGPWPDAAECRLLSEESGVMLFDTPGGT